MTVISGKCAVRSYRTKARTSAKYHKNKQCIFPMLQNPNFLSHKSKHQGLINLKSIWNSVQVGEGFLKVKSPELMV